MGRFYITSSDPDKIMYQVTPNMKNTSGPDLFFQRWIGIEHIQYNKYLKIVSRPEAGRFRLTGVVQMKYYSGDPEHEKYL